MLSDKRILAAKSQGFAPYTAKLIHSEGFIATLAYEQQTAAPAKLQ